MLIEKNIIERTQDAYLAGIGRRVSAYKIFVLAQGIENTVKRQWLINNEQRERDWNRYQSCEIIPQYVRDFCEEIIERYKGELQKMSISPYRADESL